MDRNFHLGCEIYRCEKMKTSKFYVIIKGAIVSTLHIRSNIGAESSYVNDSS